MSVVWDGLPGKTASHLFVLPTQTKSILALPTHTVLLREVVVIYHVTEMGIRNLSIYEPN